jgi:hypothetical protein
MDDTINRNQSFKLSFGGCNMIAVDVNDYIGVHAAGIRVLNENLGPDVTNVFLNLSRGGVGDFTAERRTRPPMTDAEYDKFIERAEAEPGAILD